MGDEDDRGLDRERSNTDKAEMSREERERNVADAQGTTSASDAVEGDRREGEQPI